jgi:hypothetical protein
LASVFNLSIFAFGCVVSYENEINRELKRKVGSLMRIAEYPFSVLKTATKEKKCQNSPLVEVLLSGKKLR